MTATPATAFSPAMTKLTSNASGAIENLPDVSIFGGRVRAQVATIALASQTAPTVIGVARLPIGAVPVAFLAVTDTSLSNTTIQLGDAASGNSAIYAASQTFTSTNTPTLIGKQAVLGVEITTGYDCVSAASAPYEDVILTLATATAPSTGNLSILTLYVID